MTGSQPVAHECSSALLKEESAKFVIIKKHSRTPLFCNEGKKRFIQNFIKYLPTDV